MQSSLAQSSSYVRIYAKAAQFLVLLCSSAASSEAQIAGNDKKPDKSLQYFFW